MLNRQRRIEFTVGIEGTADIEWPRRLDQVVESDPEPTLASSKCRNAAAPVSRAIVGTAVTGGWPAQPDSDKGFGIRTVPKAE
jgi:hypothetical protein